MSDNDSLSTPLQNSTSPDAVNAQSSPAPQPAQPSQPSLAQTTQTLSGSAQPSQQPAQPQQPAQQSVDSNAAADTRPRTGMFARVLYGALHGLANHGIPGAIEGAISPNTANTEFQQRQQMNVDAATMSKARASMAVLNVLGEHQRIDQQDEAFKQSMSDHNTDKMLQWAQQYGVTPTHMIDDHAVGATGAAQDIVNSGHTPLVLHAPAPDGAHGQLYVYDLTNLTQTAAKAGQIPTFAKDGLGLLGDKTDDAAFRQMSPQQKEALIQKGATGIDYVPAASAGEIAQQMADVASRKRLYIVAHGNDSDVQSQLDHFDRETSNLKSAYNTARQNEATNAKTAAQQAGEKAGAIASATGEQQKNIAEANKANQEAISTSALSTPDSLGFTPNIAQVGGAKNYESIAKSFKKNADDLAQTDQMYSQFQSVMKDVNSGKDITGAQSVVTLFNSIGLSAEPLKGKGFRINNATVEEHANARGLGEGLYQKLLRVKDGDVITPQQIKDYASIAQQSWIQKHVAIATEAHNAGVNADFALPSGNGQSLDKDTAKIFLALTGGDANKAIAAAQKKGWQ